MEGSWFLAKNPVCNINDTEPSDWWNHRWFASIAKAWISLHLLAVARANRKAVLIVTWSLDALCRCSYGAFCRQTKTQDKSHFGVRDLCTGHCNLKDLIKSDNRTDSITSLKFMSIWDHGPIALDDTYLIFFLRKVVNKEVGCNCKRGWDQIDLLSMHHLEYTTHFESQTFWVDIRLDFETKSAMFCEIFLSLIDGLITPKREEQVMGELDVENILLIVSVVLETVEDKLELILTVVTPLRTMDVGAKVEQ